MEWTLDVREGKISRLLRMISRRMPPMTRPWRPSTFLVDGSRNMIVKSPRLSRRFSTSDIWTGSQAGDTWWRNGWSTRLIAHVHIKRHKHLTISTDDLLYANNNKLNSLQSKLLQSESYISQGRRDHDGLRTREHLRKKISGAGRKLIQSRMRISESGKQCLKSHCSSVHTFKKITTFQHQIS